MYTQTNGGWDTLAIGLMEHSTAEVTLTGISLRVFTAPDEQIRKSIRRFMDSSSSALPISIIKEDVRDKHQVVLHIALGALENNEEALKLLHQE